MPNTLSESIPAQTKEAQGLLDTGNELDISEASIGSGEDKSQLQKELAQSWKSAGEDEGKVGAALAEKPAIVTRTTFDTELTENDWQYEMIAKGKLSPSTRVELTEMIAAERSERAYAALKNLYQNDPDSRVKFSAGTLLLKTFNDHTVLGSPEEMIESESALVRKGMIDLLAQYKGKEAADTVKEMFQNDPDISVRKEAAGILSRWKDDAVIEPLLAEFGARNQQWDGSDLALLMPFHDKRIDTLMIDLADEPQYEGGALTVLATHKNPAAITPLVQALDRKNVSKETVIDLLSNFPADPESVGGILRAMKDRSVLRSGLECFASMYQKGGEKTAGMVIAATSNPELEKAALMVLAKIRPEGTKDLLVSALDLYSEDKLMRSLSTDALVHMHSLDQALDSLLPDLDFSEIRDTLASSMHNREDVDSFKSQLTEIRYKGKSPEQKEIAERLLEEFRKTEPVGIEFPLRFKRDVLDELIANRTDPKPDNRPLAVVIYPKDDPNLAFAEDDGTVTSLIEHGYRVMFYEAGEYSQSAEASIAEILKDAIGLGNPGDEYQPASLIVLGGHGRGDAIRFGSPGVTADQFLDLKDEQVLKEHGISRALKPNGQIILNSCETGKSGAEGENMVNFLRRIFPQAKVEGIYGSRAPVTGEHLIFSADGELIDVDYDGSVAYKG